MSRLIDTRQYDISTIPGIQVSTSTKTKLDWLMATLVATGIRHFSRALKGDLLQFSDPHRQLVEDYIVRRAIYAAAECWLSSGARKLHPYLMHIAAANEVLSWPRDILIKLENDAAKATGVLPITPFATGLVDPELFKNLVEYVFQPEIVVAHTEEYNTFAEYVPATPSYLIGTEHDGDTIGYVVNDTFVCLHGTIAVVILYTKQDGFYVQEDTRGIDSFVDTVDVSKWSDITTKLKPVLESSQNPAVCVRLSGKDNDDMAESIARRISHEHNRMAILRVEDISLLSEDLIRNSVGISILRVPVASLEEAVAAVDKVYAVKRHQYYAHNPEPMLQLEVSWTDKPLVEKVLDYATTHQSDTDKIEMVFSRRLHQAWYTDSSFAPLLYITDVEHSSEVGSAIKQWGYNFCTVQVEEIDGTQEYLYCYRFDSLGY